MVDDINEFLRRRAAAFRLASPVLVYVVRSQSDQVSRSEFDLRRASISGSQQHEREAMTRHARIKARRLKLMSIIDARASESAKVRRVALTRKMFPNLSEDEAKEAVELWMTKNA